MPSFQRRGKLSIEAQNCAGLLARLRSAHPEEEGLSSCYEFLSALGELNSPRSSNRAWVCTEAWIFRFKRDHRVTICICEGIEERRGQGLDLDLLREAFALARWNPRS